MRPDLRQCHLPGQQFHGTAFAIFHIRERTQRETRAVADQITNQFEIGKRDDWWRQIGRDQSFVRVEIFPTNQRQKQ